MTKMSGRSPKPWVRLWREERGSFAQLPLFCRALAAELLKLTDDDGRIEIGDRDPADAVAFALGADRSDRRLLRKYIPMLESDGYIDCSDGYITIIAWDRWQTMGRHEATTTEQRPNHEATTTAPRPRHDEARKCPESRERKTQETETEEDTESSAREGAVLPHELHAAWVGRWRRERPGIEPDGHQYGPQHNAESSEWRDLCRKVRSQARLSGATEREVATAIMDALFADEWAAERGYPPKLLISKFSSFAATTPKKARRQSYEDMEARRTAALTRGDIAKAKEIEAAYYAEQDARRAS